MTRRVSLAQRAEVVLAVPGRLAAVAVPVVRHPAYGLCLVVTRRTSVNGHTGARMTNAGEVVLFGGSREGDESLAETALRELCEEAGTPHLVDDGEVRVTDHLGRWVTEAGFSVDGYAVTLPDSFVDAVVPDGREVAEIAYLRVPDVLAATVNPEYHRVDDSDHLLEESGDTSFESPTLRVPRAGSGQEWVLWGLAGFMVSAWRDRNTATGR